MTNRFGLIDRLALQRVQQRLDQAARGAPHEELSVLRDQRDSARRMRGVINRLLHVAEERLALPRVGANVFPKPSGTRWAWRPAFWRGPVAPGTIVGVRNDQAFGDGIKVFHDCPLEEMTLRQIRNTDEEDLAAFGLQIDVLGFAGSFLSLVVDLPDDAVHGLRKRDIIRVQFRFAADRPMTVFTRLNIKSGPNTAQLLEEIRTDTGSVDVDFDLAYAEVNENRLERLWLDLILDRPAMNQLQIRDLTFCRYPRAEM